ncbi:hypothetical protein DSCO28_56860 [Desulfosarcina ovata subsp. sediminis]|uniref:4Fe-4S domain-containing protein n=1 Tax=Desulfosarcina ovata subsp. sediminis TaxID=885957 RepID=A0A5K7ZYF2_9BACT|nr:DUF3786 domain-containing protein [Desulfosarcina ovata]BBO85120.1 hypothetical protein DSCO28_56860 [Desulfosarcina ovata subsp. sediminis]
MPAPKNAMEIFKYLDKSNCRECGEKTCLAFAGAVFRGQKNIDDCPRIDRHVKEKFSTDVGDQTPLEENWDAFLEAMRQQIAGLDLSAAAERTGGHYKNGRLTLKILGKDFSVDDHGQLYSDIHVNPWVAAPFFDYVINARGDAPTGHWVSFRELKNGKDRYPLFQKRCEAAMKQVADGYTDLFDDVVHLFSGRQVERQFQSDISVVLAPLPKVPVMICYWRPDEGLGSSLNIFFDETADRNLDTGSVFSLGAGLTQMFQKLALRHGFTEASA